MFFICIWNYTLANACDDKFKIVAAPYTTHTPWITREKNQPFLIKILRSDYPILYLLNYYYYMTLKEEEENLWNRDWMRAMDQRPETVEQIFTLGSFASTSFFGSFLSSCFWRNLFRGCVCVWVLRLPRDFFSFLIVFACCLFRFHATTPSILFLLINFTWFCAFNNTLLLCSVG